MFKALEAFLENVNLSLTITRKGDKISVTVLPKSKDKDNKDNNTPLLMTGTADELDENFADTVGKSLGTAIGFITNADQFVKAAEKKEADVKKEAADKVAAKSSTKSTTTKAADKKEYTRSEKEAIEIGKKSLEKAKTTKDPDMVSYLRKSAIKAYDGVALPTDDISKEFDSLLVYQKKTEETPAEDDTGLFAEAESPVKKAVKPAPKAVKEEPAVVEEEEEDLTDDEADEIVKGEEDDDDDDIF